MNIQKYTEKAQEAIVGAQSMADREGHPEITPEHLLLGLVEQEGGIVPEILRKMSIDPAAVATAVRAELGKSPRAHGGSQPPLSARLRQVTAGAEATTVPPASTICVVSVTCCVAPVSLRTLVCTRTTAEAPCAVLVADGVTETVAT